ncbi:group III truncated hemoglobin [Kitasatospora albolonga]|uniref:group III truncated hemoglobin n=1 Tax=Kitasatospora albolonga TaxID=68173 RepID=UPI0031E7F833
MRRGPHRHPDRADLELLLRRFYGAAFADPLIGPYFTALAGTRLERHLPHIADFWERALLRTAEYRRDVFEPHAVLHAQQPLTGEHFGRWVQLWQAPSTACTPARARSGQGPGPADRGRPAQTSLRRGPRHGRDGRLRPAQRGAAAQRGGIDRLRIGATDSAPVRHERSNRSPTRRLRASGADRDPTSGRV